jgi:hypothetical protein
LVRERSRVQSSLAAPAFPYEITAFSDLPLPAIRQEQAEQGANLRADTGKIRGLLFPSRSGPPDPQKQSPATAATGSGANAEKKIGEDQSQPYQNPASGARFMPSPLHIARQAFYDRAGFTREASAYLARHRLNLGLIEAHAGILAFCDCEFFTGDDGQAIFRTAPDGVPSAVVEALNVKDGHSVVDLVAWPLDAPEAFATAVQSVHLLGAASLYWKPKGKPIELHETPLDWIKAQFTGCVPINPEWAGYWLHKAGGPFIAQSAAHGREIREMLGGQAGQHKILVKNLNNGAAS